MENNNFNLAEFLEDKGQDYVPTREEAEIMKVLTEHYLEQLRIESALSSIIPQ